MYQKRQSFRMLMVVLCLLILAACQAGGNGSQLVGTPNVIIVTPTPAPYMIYTSPLMSMPKAPANTDRFSIGSVNFVADSVDLPSSIVVLGEIRNESSVVVHRIRVRINLLNEQGHTVDSETTALDNIGNMGPGETYAFELNMSRSDGIEHFSSYDLEVFASETPPINSSLGRTEQTGLNIKNVTLSKNDGDYNEWTVSGAVTNNTDCTLYSPHVWVTLYDHNGAVLVMKSFTMALEDENGSYAYLFDQGKSNNFSQFIAFNITSMKAIYVTAQAACNQ